MKIARVKILVASSSESLTAEVRHEITGTDITMLAASDGVEAIYVAERSKPDVLVLDEEITKIPGPDIATLIKRLPGLEQLRVIYLHAGSVHHLNGMADQYIRKPLGIRELITAVTDYTSRKITASPSLKKIVGHLIVDRETYLVSYKGKKLLLPRKEFELVYLLASNPEKVFTREEIFMKIWGREFTVKAGRTIDVHIRKLRIKLAEDLITTIKGIGYKIG